MRRILTAALLTFFISAAFAQKEKMRVGVMAGLNYTTLNGTINQYPVLKSGGSCSMYFRGKLSNAVYLQGDLLFFSTGCINYYNDSYRYLSGKTKLAVYYAGIPLVFKFYPFKGLNIQAGGYTAFRIKALEQGTVEQYDQSGMYVIKTDIRKSMTGFYKIPDAGLVFGLGHDGRKSGIDFGVKMHIGFVDIAGDPLYLQKRTALEQAGYPVGKMTNFLLNFYIGYAPEDQ